MFLVPQTPRRRSPVRPQQSSEDRPSVQANDSRATSPRCSVSSTYDSTLFLPAYGKKMPELINVPSITRMVKVELITASNYHPFRGGSLSTSVPRTAGVLLSTSVPRTTTATSTSKITVIRYNRMSHTHRHVSAIH